ncbi:MAG: hypothetical protein ABFC67_14700 [Mizugakiibacter sp.]|uniref:hypothetical protein n=1 Tax=Mizugakiibacter sp. TaxID=1972610 RepID=UPI00320F68D2
MSEHTKEPWRLGRLANIRDFGEVKETVGPHQIVVDNEFGPYVLAECNMNFKDDALANARRIVACVNACEQMETEWLEEYAKDIEPAMKSHHALRQQRDKLRDAWKAACAFIDSHAADPDITSAMASNYAEFMRHRAEIEASL